MATKQFGHCILLLATLNFACVFNAITPALGEERGKPSIEKWRPKDGTYAGPGKDFESQCGEFGDVVIQLAEKSISGSEWGCKINKLTDTEPGNIKLDMTCNDYNLGLSINPRDPNVYERKYKEVMLLKRINEKAMSVRKTLNGKFKGSSWQADYCPEEAQRIYMESRARGKEEAERKAAEKNPWHPLDGIYAAAGANFEDRCLKTGDAAIDVAQRTISSGTDKCNINSIRHDVSEIRMFVTCGQQTDASDSIGKTSSSSETIILKRTGDKTIFMQKSKNGNFVEPGEQLSYCGSDAQKKFAQQKARK